MGIVSSIGNNTQEVLASLYEAKSGISRAEKYAELGFRSQVQGAPTLNPADVVDRRAMRFLGEGAAWNHVAMEQAILDAGLEPSDVSNVRTGIIMGSGGPSTRTQVEAADKPTQGKGQVAKPPDVGTKPGADKDPNAVTDLGRKGAKKGKGALFRVASDGRLDQLHALTATYFTSLVVTAEGTVYAGAADKGRVYMVDNDQAVATAFDVRAASFASSRTSSGRRSLALPGLTRSGAVSARTLSAAVVTVVAVVVVRQRRRA